MPKLLVGSSAAKHWFSDYREPRDLDYWQTDEPETKSYTNADNKKVEIKDVSKFKALRELLYTVIPYGEIADPSTLYMIKLSHSFWDIHWSKTVQDILFFQEKQVKLNAWQESYIPEMVKEWEGIHGKKKAYLNKSNDDFFKDNVKRVYEHDSIHEAISYYGEPLYKSCKKDQSKAMLSEKLFDNLSFSDKLKLVREETYTTSLERFIIPSNYEKNAVQAYRAALKKLITSMTKSWFPLFIVKNLTELQFPDRDYVQIFKDNIHKVRKINESKTA